MGLKQGKTLAINGHAWTNPLSEFTRPALSVVVERWMSALAATGIFVSAITEAELRYGLALMPKGRRQRQLFAQVEAMLAEEFADRILPIDSSATLAYAHIAAARRLSGRPISQANAQIAAIAASRGALLATRNGIDVIDPWRKGA